MRVRRWQTRGNDAGNKPVPQGILEEARKRSLKNKDLAKAAEEKSYALKMKQREAESAARPQRRNQMRRESQFSPYRDEESSPLAGIAPHHLPEVEPSASGSRATVSMLSAGIGGFLPQPKPQTKAKSEQELQDEADDNYLGVKRLPAVSQARKDGIEEEFQPEIEAIIEQEQARQEVRNNPKYKNMVDADKASASRRKAR